MWNVSSKKVIDRVWRKTSFHCKGKPFFKNAHSNSQKLVKSLRVNHFDSTTSRFRTQIWKIRLDIWRDGKLFFKRSKWTDMDNLSSLWDKGSHQSYHWDLWMHYQMVLLHSLLLHWRRENCVAYLPQVQLRHQKVHNDEMMINPWESLWWIKYIISNKIDLYEE